MADAVDENLWCERKKDLKFCYGLIEIKSMSQCKPPLGDEVTEREGCLHPFCPSLVFCGNSPKRNGEAGCEWSFQRL